MVIKSRRARILPLFDWDESHDVPRAQLGGHEEARHDAGEAHDGVESLALPTLPALSIPASDSIAQLRAC